MKKRLLFFLTLSAAVVLAACNDNSDADYAHYYSFATTRHINGLASDYYFTSDSGKSIYPGDKSRIGAFTAEEGTRVIVYFNQLEQPVSGYDINAALYGIDTNVRMGDTATATSAAQIETLGNAGTSFNMGYIRLTPGYLNILLGYDGSTAAKHTFTLVRNLTPDYTPGQTAADYLNLELRHRNDDSSSLDTWTWLSFPYTDFATDLSGKKGIILRIETRQNGTQYVQLDLPTAATSALSPVATSRTIE